MLFFALNTRFNSLLNEGKLLIYPLLKKGWEFFFKFLSLKETLIIYKDETPPIKFLLCSQKGSQNDPHFEGHFLRLANPTKLTNGSVVMGPKFCYYWNPSKE
jgi:hypothetical protein